MAVTIYDIAQKAQLSHSAVSMALRGSTRVSAATRARVCLLAEQMGYQPNFFARGLKTAETRMIAAVMPLDHPPFQDMLREIQQQCALNGYHVIWQNLTPVIREQRFIFNLLGQGLFDGALVMLYDYEPVSDLIENFLRGGRPMVVFGPPNDLPADSGVCTVRVSSDKALRSVTQLLLDQGHRRLVHVVHEPMLSHEESSHALIAELVRGHGIEERELRWVGNFSADRNYLLDGYQCAQQMIRQHTEVTAIQCPNDLFGIGFVKAMNEAGLSVPGDISLVGSGNMQAGAYSLVPLTTINSPLMTAQGCRLLQDQLNGSGRAGESILLNAEVVLRDSIGPVRGNRRLGISENNP